MIPRSLAVAVATALLASASACSDRAAESVPDPSGPPPRTDAPAPSTAAPSTPAEPVADARQERRGRWHERRTREPYAPGHDGTGVADIEAMGYAGAYEEGDDVSGAIAHDPARMEPGYTLLCTGHAPTVLLIDAVGDVRYRWDVPLDKAFPEGLPYEPAGDHADFIRRAWPFPNGDLLLVFEYTGIARVRADGTSVWSAADHHHHDFQIQPDGRIVALAMNQVGPPRVREKYRTHLFDRGVTDNSVVVLSPDGEELQRFSILDAFVGSDHAAFLGTLPKDKNDVFHANSVFVVTDELAEEYVQFDAGDILVSMRTPSALIAIDPESGLVSWLAQGSWHLQHQASALPNGRILLLDNGGGNTEIPLRFDRSRVIEWEPTRQTIEWQFPAPGSSFDFHTHYLGYVERLRGGNTLITESTQGRVLEVAPDGSVVWEYVSPFRAGESDELITTLMGARRIAPEDVPFVDR